MIEFEGRRHEFPGDATDTEISGALAHPPAAQTAPASAAASNGFIEINAPDGSTVRFPSGTADAVIVDVMRQHYPAPHPLAALPTFRRSCVRQDTRTVISVPCRPLCKTFSMPG
ncbi:MAG: hypothetical protein WAV72_06030 [Bradyrhizobium sp.]